MILWVLPRDPNIVPVRKKDFTVEEWKKLEGRAIQLSVEITDGVDMKAVIDSAESLEVQPNNAKL